MRRPPHQTVCVPSFQSAPGREAGRCASTMSRLAISSMFQSAPGREAGRCAEKANFSGSSMQFQSAPGREAGRCPAPCITSAMPRLFQSAPGREAGRCRARCGPGGGWLGVSIRARPGGRAMPAATAGSPATKWFQSAPGREAGRCCPPAACRWTSKWFQSAPGREAGRCREEGRFDHLPLSFNPRPAGRPGDASIVSPNRQFNSVSIRARPGGRAMPQAREAIHIPEQFQSAPGREAGRCAALITDCFDCGTMQACASPLPRASPAGISLISSCDKFIKNKVLRLTRNPGDFVVAWGSRFISPGGLRNRPSGRRRTASPLPQPVR